MKIRKIKKSSGFVLADVIIGVVIVAALSAGVTYTMMSSSSLSLSAASCASESEFYGYTVACANILMANSGTEPTIAEMNTNCFGVAPFANSVEDGSGNVDLNPGATGINTTADPELVITEAPLSISVNCTDDQ